MADTDRADGRIRIPWVGPMVVARRRCALIVDRPADLRFKQPELSAQTLVIVEGLTFDEVAEALCVPPGTFRSLSSRTASKRRSSGSRVDATDTTAIAARCHNSW